MGLPLSYWEALRCETGPLRLMKFTLIYDGDLPSAGNATKPIPASRIRNAFHDQLADLWDSHVLLRELAHTARVPANSKVDLMLGVNSLALPDYREPIPPVKEGYVDLCAPIDVPKVG